MHIRINLKKSLHENASEYFDKAKKQKKKIATIQAVLATYEKKVEQLNRNAEEELAKEQERMTPAPRREKKWYEKFHWFISSDGFLVVGGRDAMTNETIIKKFTDKNDLVFHTELPGSPFCVVKTEGKTVGEKTIHEAALFCALYSRMWKLQIIGDVFYVTPDQVTKETRAGEFIQKGAFMIYGKKNFVKNIQLEMAMGVKNEELLAGPVSAVQARADVSVLLIPGDTKSSDLAKKIQKKLGGDLDEIIRFLPAGNGKIKEK